MVNPTTSTPDHLGYTDGRPTTWLGNKIYAWMHNGIRWYFTLDGSSWMPANLSAKGWGRD